MGDEQKKAMSVDELLRFDALAEAERLTGSSYKDDEGTACLGFGMHIAAGQKKAETLQKLGDTFFGIEWGSFVRLLQSSPVGLSLEWQGKFKDDQHGTDGDEVAFVNRTRSVLVYAHSYGHPSWYAGSPVTVNMAHAYFQIQLSEEGQHSVWGIPYSGGCVDRDSWTWGCDVDGREGLFHWLNKLETVGTLVPWRFPMHFWPLNYVEVHEGDRIQKEAGNRADFRPFDELILRKVAQWPPVLRAMGEAATADLRKHRP